MHILLPSTAATAPSEPLWLPAPDYPALPVNQIHLWRMRLGGTRWSGGDSCPVSRDRAEKMQAALFRNDVLERYTSAADGSPAFIAGPASGLRVALAQCDHLALIAVSRNVRGLGLDVEQVRDDIPFEEMAGGFLDPRSQWDLRITWSPQEKAWKFFQFWTSNEACAQAHPCTRSVHSCQIREFSPEADFIAALAIEGGPEADVLHLDWQP